MSKRRVYSTGAAAPKPASPPQSIPPAEVSAPRDSWIDQCFPVLFPVLAFLSMTATSRAMAVAFALVCAALCVGRGAFFRLRARLTPLTLAVALYALILLIAGLRSDFGASALLESIKTSIALSIFWIALTRTKQNGGVERILRIIAVCCALFGFLCIDGSSTLILTRGFASVMNLFRVSYDPAAMGYEAGVRITGIFSNANVSGGVLAFGCLISLFLARTEADGRRRMAAFALLGINALAFFLSFSMGAMGAFALACCAYLAAERREERFSLFLLMMETVAVTVLLAFLAYRFLGVSGPGAILPLLCALADGAAVWALDRFAGRKLLEKLAGQGRAVGVSIAAIAAAAAVYVVLAVNLTGGVTLQGGESLSRAVYPAAGSYTVAVDGGGVSAVIYSQNESELMMHTRSTLYEGALSEASFTVPENARIVWFDLTAQGETRLSSVTLSDGTALKLGYRLLPGFAANRLQGFAANQNFLQRLVFFSDGVKLWKQSPLLGFGLAAVEGRLTGVQSFFYETKYIHNHFIQLLDEAGVVGLISFLLLLVCAVAPLLRRRKSENRGGEFALFAACLTMMIAHSLTEVVWSTGVYQSLTFLLFAALILYCGVPMAKSSGRGAVRLTGAAVLGIILFFGAACGGNLLAAVRFSHLQAATQAEFMDAMVAYDRMDAYDDESYKVNYIGNALSSGDMTARGRADAYALQLRGAEEYTACTDAAYYYYLPLGQWKNAFDASRAAIAQEGSNADAWNYQMEAYRTTYLQYLTEGDTEQYLTGVNATADYLSTFNQGRMQEIVLTEENQAFLGFLEGLAKLSEADCYAALTEAYPVS